MPSNLTCVVLEFNRPPKLEASPRTWVDVATGTFSRPTLCPSLPRR
jgi:hypothetical protein